MSHNQQTVQSPAAVEMRADKQGVYVAVRGTEQDSLSDVTHCAHSELKWLWDRDEMALINDQRPTVIQPR